MTRRVAKLGFVAKRRLAVLAAVTIAATVACSDPLGPQTQRDELQEAQDLWRSRRPLRYAYTIQRQCFCTEDARGPVRVTVAGETVVSQLYEDGRMVDAAATDWFPSVDGLFAVLLDAIDEGAYEIRVTYDAQFGVPVDFWIDYSQNIIDEELGFMVTAAVQPIS